MKIGLGCSGRTVDYGEGGHTTTLGLLALAHGDRGSPDVKGLAMNSVPVALVRGMRPKQWLKNLLVGAAPLAAGSLRDIETFVAVFAAFAIFCAASSGIYLLNDLLDVEADRAHPTKKLRPIASGELPAQVAWAASVVLLISASVIPLAAGKTTFAIVVVVYEIIQISYCLILKHLVVIDLVIVSSGFLIRAVAGAAILDLPVSQWFLLVTSFGSLFMVAGKRFSEKLHAVDDEGSTRRSLVGYSLSYLRFVWALAAGLALISYSLWAFELDSARSTPLTAISIVPFGTALLRYAYSIDTGHAGTPEDTVLGDPQLLALGIVWLAIFAAAVAIG